MSKYPGLPRSVYVQRVETVKQLGTHGSLVVCGGYVFPAVVKPEILTFKVKFTLKVKVNHPPKL